MERPILFSTEMVQALLDGRKTLTRRTNGLDNINELPSDWEADKVTEEPRFFFFDKNEEDYMEEIGCLFGKVGDLLWVKESFYAYGHWSTITDTVTKKARKRFNDLTRDSNYVHQFCSDWTPKTQAKFGELGWHKRPSLFMPKKAARIWLKVIDVRVQRLQEISEQDAIKEGVESLPPNKYKNYLGKEYLAGIKLNYASESFKTLWKSINGFDSWDANPWVWVIEFEVLSTTGKPNVKEVGV